MNTQQMKEEVHKYALKAYRVGLMAGTSGNFSLLDPSRQMVAITPTGLDYEQMSPSDIAIIDLEGNQLEGDQQPSSEWQMHTELYKKMRVNAVAHTHVPYATAFAVLGREIPVVLVEMVVLGGSVPVAPFALAGTKELGEKVVQTLMKEQKFACLLKNHGALTIGSSLEECYMRSVYLEDAAKIYQYSLAVGEPQVIDDSDVKRMKEKLGIRFDY